MINVYWFDEHSSSKQNGIGTYRNILLPRLKKVSGINLTLVSLNSDCLDLEIKDNEIIVPSIASGEWRDNGALILPVLKQYIEDTPNNVFMLNHSPCNEFAKTLKELFPLSKITFTIHDQAWCNTLRGSSDMLRQILIDGMTPKELSKDAISYVKSRATQDMELYKMVDAVICLSESTANVLKDIYGVPENKVHFIPNGYESSNYKRPEKSTIRKELGLREDDEVLLFVGRPSENKGIIPLLIAISQLKTTHPQIKCVFTGNLNGMSKFWNIGGKIASNLICIGHVPHDELQRWYAAADLGVIASYSEQCSYAALEMMECGLPIIASDGNGLKDMFKNEENAFVAHIDNVFNPDSYAVELAKRIDSALESSESFKNKMAKRNLKLLKDKYSADKMTQYYEHVLTKIS